MRYFLAASLAIAASAANAQWLRLQFTSDPGDFIGQGQTRDILYTPGNTAFFNVELAKWGSSGPDFFRFSGMRLPISTDYLTVDVGTNQLGHALQTGVYTNAERASFASPGHAGLDIGFQHRGSNTLTGRFEIQDLAYTTLNANEWRLDRFKMTFEQHSEGGTPAMRGTVTYNAVPEPATLFALGAPLVAFARRRRRKAA